MFKKNPGNTKRGGKKSARQYCVLSHISLVIKVTIIMLSYNDNEANTAVVTSEKIFK